MRKTVLVVVLLLVFTAACDWPQFLAGPAQTGSSPDTSISAAALAAGTFESRWGAPLGQSRAVLTSGGVVFASVPGDEIQAYDPDGAPLWKTGGSGAASGANGSAIAEGFLVTSHFTGELSAYDATGSAGCSGDPKVCTPLWTATSRGFSAYPVLANGTVYVTYDSATNPGSVGLAAYDLDGEQQCSGEPTVCEPRWSSELAGAGPSVPAVSGGSVYFTSSVGLHVLDAATGARQWDATIPGGRAGERAPAVANGKVFVAGASPKHVLGYDAAGVQRCGGTPKRCLVTWRARQAGPSPSVANGVLYALTPDGLAAFDATGVACTGDAVRTCPVQRTYAGGGADCYWAGVPCGFSSAITVAGGVVYHGSASRGPSLLNAWDANGTIACAGSPTTCNPIGASFGSSAAVAISNGLVFTTEGFGDSFRALALVPD